MRHTAEETSLSAAGRTFFGGFMEDHIRFDRERGELLLLDQRLLPVEERTVSCRTLDDVVRALQVMVVRGAPAIGVTAGFGAAPRASFSWGVAPFPI